MQSHQNSSRFGVWGRDLNKSASKFYMEMYRTKESQETHEEKLGKRIFSNSYGRLYSFSYNATVSKTVAQG